MAKVLKSTVAEINIPNVGLAEFVLENADSVYKDKTAVVDVASGRTLTYPELSASVRCVASGFRRLGLKRGQVVAIVAPNSAEWIECFLGVLMSGGVTTGVNPLYTAQEIEYQMKDSSSVMVVTIPQLLDKVTQAATGCGHIQKTIVFGDAPVGCVAFSDLQSDDVTSPPPAISYDVMTEVACLPYSSGTTGLPKGVMLTHHNLVANISQSRHPVVFKSQVRYVTQLTLLPFFHIYGMGILICNFLNWGNKLIVLPRFQPDMFLKAIQDHKVSSVCLVPPLVTFLAKSPLVDNYDLTSLTDISCGAAPLNPELQHTMEERLKIERDIVVQGYGLTETSPVVVVKHSDGSKEGSIGKLLPMTQCKVLDVESRELLGPNMDGELCFKGPQVMLGYLNKPEQTKACLDEEGWFYTGDVGHYDEEGFLFIVDRIKELIKFKGFQVAPAELEGLLISHPAVADAAVIGVPSEEAGELPRAYIVLKPTHSGLKEEVIAKYVEDNKAPHKRLRGGVEFVTQIPKTASGKILRRQIKDEYLAKR